MKKCFIWFTLLGLTAAFILTGCSPAKAVDYDAVKKQVRTTLQNLLDKAGTSVSYAVMQDGKLIMADAVGYLDGTKKTQATTDTLYNIGSVSKVYCAAAVMKLVDEGKVNLDEPVAKYLPEFKMPDGRYRDITVRMLLNHSSALPGTAYTLVMVYNEYDTGIYQKEYEIFAKSDLKAEPGRFSVYCNDGFMLAEMLVAKVSGKTYSQYVRDSVFTPVSAASSGFADREYEPGSYAVEGTKPHEFLNYMGSGGISTNLTDLCRFGQIFLNGGQGVISESSTREMSTAQGKTYISGDNCSPNYGLGWDSVDYAFDSYDFGKGVLAKSGGTDQFVSQLYVIPQYNMVCAISATLDFSGDAAAALGDIAADVLRVQGNDVSKEIQTSAGFAHQPLPESFKKDYEGIYGAYNDVLRVTVNKDDSISTGKFNGKNYKVKDAKLYFDGTAFVDENGKKVYSFTEANGKKYLMEIKEGTGLECAAGQKLEALPIQSGAWENRTGKLYLASDVSMDAALILPGITLYEDASLPGIIIAGLGDMFSPMGIKNDDATKMILQIPGNSGRDLYTLHTKTVDGEEWLYTESYDLRPAAALAVLKQGTLSIGHSGGNAMYKLPGGTLTFTMQEGGRVIAYDSGGIPVYDSITDGASAFDKLPKEGYIRFVGKPDTCFTVTVK